MNGIHDTALLTRSVVHGPLFLEAVLLLLADDRLEIGVRALVSRTKLSRSQERDRTLTRFETLVLGSFTWAVGIAPTRDTRTCDC